MNDEVPVPAEPAATPAPAPVPAPVPARIRLGVVSFGLALGLTSAILVFLLGISAALLDWGGLAAQVLSSMFVGFGPTFVGAISGAVWAFVDGFVAGMLVAWFYNKISGRHH
ncbi:MAG: bacteriophage holin [Rhodospirillaceae bacterium]|jgi:hypothetical protein|nr:bacteriophage holin [Rhodospirillaceae bacterium]MBT3883767.1 bacteriophage holin [Rhodospirillaceae bacterium]MBT4115440.1 bacteriophage holin [Rhodospirillaceae bacterium]MBT4672407.1 bacteriophage holin [Rhodospirillaceae bacterium]MBT4722089.1 bacteriophage holin [Rhodospirillaceae bacterium]